MTPCAEVAAQIEAYVRDKEPRLQEVVRELRRRMQEWVPGVGECLNPHGVPAFDFHGPICYFMVGKGHVTFGFYRATSLPDPHGLLEGTGNNLRHVKVRRVAELGREGLRELVQAAAAQNAREPLDRMARPMAP